jgi:hypothetical protein
MNGRPANTATSSSSQPAAVRAMPSLPVRVAGSGTAGVAGWAQALNCIVQSSLFIVKFKLYSDVGSSKAFHWASLKPFASQPACCLKLLHTGNCCTPTNQPTTCNGWRLWHCWSWAMARCRRHLKLFLPAVWSGWGGGATGVIDPEESPATQKLRLKVHDIRLKLIRAARRLGYEHDSGLVKQVPRRLRADTCSSALESSCQTRRHPPAVGIQDKGSQGAAKSGTIYDSVVHFCQAILCLQAAAETPCLCRCEGTMALPPSLPPSLYLRSRCACDIPCSWCKCCCCWCWCWCCH